MSKRNQFRAWVFIGMGIILSAIATHACVGCRQPSRHWRPAPKQETTKENTVPVLFNGVRASCWDVCKALPDYEETSKIHTQAQSALRVWLAEQGRLASKESIEKLMQQHAQPHTKDIPGYAMEVRDVIEDGKITVAEFSRLQRLWDTGTYQIQTKVMLDAMGRQFAVPTAPRD